MRECAPGVALTETDGNVRLDVFVYFLLPRAGCGSGPYRFWRTGRPDGGASASAGAVAVAVEAVAVAGAVEARAA